MSSRRRPGPIFPLSGFVPRGSTGDAARKFKIFRHDGSRPSPGRQRWDGTHPTSCISDKPITLYKGQPSGGGRGSSGMRFARIDQSPVARWWWTVDRWSLFALGTLIGLGILLSLGASPSVAERIGYDAL